MSKELELAENTFVWVRRQWNDYRDAMVHLTALSGVHWANQSVGVGAGANRFYLHGYVSCDAVLEGEIAHSCRHGEGPHVIKVCILKSYNEPSIYKWLLKKAGPNPNQKRKALNHSPG